MKSLSFAVAAAFCAMSLMGMQPASAAKLKSPPKDPSKKITVYYPSGVIKKVCTGTGQKHCAGN